MQPLAQRCLQAGWTGRSQQMAEALFSTHPATARERPVCCSSACTALRLMHCSFRGLVPASCICPEVTNLVGLR